jgi:KUP system potassium uptake protein
MTVASPNVAIPSSDLRPPQRWASLTALGIVYGDLGTSPLYTLQTIVEATGGRFTTDSALGILSLIVWTLIITISVKYCVFVMRAGNDGEGGILALMSLVGANSFKGWEKVLAVMGLLGAALLYGDGVITPAISVLSALEGVNVVTSALKSFVMPVSVGILVAFFALQRFGTAKIGGAFGPIMLLWFVVIAILGLTGIIRNPAVLTAIDPRYAIVYLAHSGGVGLLVLGGAVLCITGGEALYADMGHFGPGPIRLSWYVVVLPALLLSYAGQTALMIQKGTIQGNPFFQLAPAWSVYPLVFLATVATIIASQSIVTGSFSMTRQAMQLGWLPGFDIRQTSDKVYGQIYVPVVNWLMMAATIGIYHRFSKLRPAGRRLWHGGVHDHAPDHMPSVHRHAKGLGLVDLAVLPCCGGLPHCGYELLRREPAEDRGRGLAAAQHRRRDLLHYADLALRHRRRAAKLGQRLPARRTFRRRPRGWQGAPRARDSDLPDPYLSAGSAAADRPCPPHGCAA